MSAETDTATTATANDTVSSRDSRVIWLLLGAAFVVILNETIMNVAIPHLMGDLGITALAAQWLTTAFMLTMAVVIPITGFLLQRFTTRQAFIGGMSLFSLGTLVAAIAPGFEVLLAARVIQASGTAVMMPLLITTLMTVVPAHSRGRMMGRVSVVISVAPAVGPTLSGVILDSALGWRGLFIVVLPIAVAMLAVGARWITDVGQTRRVRIDAVSVLLSAFGFGGIVYGLSQIGAAAHGGSASADAAGATATTALWISLAVGTVALGAFVWRQLRLQRDDAALLDLRVFRSTNFTVSMAQMLVLSLAFFGSITVLPLYLQRVLQLSALETGLVVFPGALAMGLTGPLIGRIYDKRGTAVLVIPGAVIASASLWFYAGVDQSTPVWLIVAVQVLLSLGLAMSFTPLFTASLGSLPPHLYSYGSAIVSTVQQVAGAAGIAVFVTVMAGVSATAMASGSAQIPAEAAGVRAAFLVGAIISLLSVVGSFLVRKPADSPHAAAEAAH